MNPETTKLLTECTQTNSGCDMYSRWWFQMFFHFHHDPCGEKNNLTCACFSDRVVQPPTNQFLYIYKTAPTKKNKFRFDRTIGRPVVFSTTRIIHIKVVGLWICQTMACEWRLLANLKTDGWIPWEIKTGGFCCWWDDGGGIFGAEIFWWY